MEPFRAVPAEPPALTVGALARVPGRAAGEPDRRSRATAGRRALTPPSAEAAAADGEIAAEAATASSSTAEPPAPASAETSAFAEALSSHLRLFQQLGALEGRVAEAADRLGACLSAGGKLLICGNGMAGSAAQQLAAELAGQGGSGRRPMAALALCADGAALSGCSSLHGFDRALARHVQALGRAGDALLLLHAAGPTANLVQAAALARDAGMLTVGLLGSASAGLLPLCHLAIELPGTASDRVEEAVVFIGRTLSTQILASLDAA